LGGEEIKFYGADHSPRGVQPSLVCLSVIAKPRQCGGFSPIGAVALWEVN